MTVTPAEFQSTMVVLLHSWCDRPALYPLRTVLPHYPMFNGTTDELVELRTALKTVRVSHHDKITPQEMVMLVAVHHVVESALASSGHA